MSEKILGTNLFLQLPPLLLALTGFLHLSQWGRFLSAFEESTVSGKIKGQLIFEFHLH
ncbi:MAG: hypothetical protein ACFFBS_10045 [Promethearchaeota archaeon]